MNAIRPVRPWPSPSDVPWREARFAVIDLETTGLSVVDEIVSVGAVQVREGRVLADVHYEIARPTATISPESMCLHALTPDAVRDAAPVPEVVARLADVVRGHVVVAHAAWVERQFLNRALRPVGERLPQDMVDTAALACYLGIVTRVGGHEPPLEGLAQMLGIPVHTPHHALGDAQTTAQVLLVLAARLEAQRPGLTVRDLCEISAAEGW